MRGGIQAKNKANMETAKVKIPNWKQTIHYQMHEKGQTLPG